MKLQELLESESIIERFHDLIHHIAEEELVACKVYRIEEPKKNTIKIIADCQDISREEGLQPDLTRKVMERLKKHPMQRLNRLNVQVIHKNIDTFSVGEK